MLNLSPLRVLIGHSSGLYLTPTCSWGFLVAATRSAKHMRMSERKSMAAVGFLFVGDALEKSRRDSTIIHLGLEDAT